MTTAPRVPTALDAVADTYVAEAVALSPMLATFLGEDAGQDRIDDASPEGLAARAELARRTLAAVEATPPQDDVDRVTRAALQERLGLELEEHDAGFDAMNLNVIESYLQQARSIFDLMPTATEQDWETLTARLRGLPDAYAGWQASLALARDRGQVAARRQVAECVTQCQDLVTSDGWLAGLVDGARVDGRPMPGALGRELGAAADRAATAYRDLADWLTRELLPHAPEADGVGRERYALASRTFLGARVDLDETYAWGQEELARISADMDRTADRITPGGTVKEAIAALEEDPRYRLEGTDALQAWMQGQAEDVMDLLDGTHFDLETPVRTIECCIAPTQTGGIYYTPPSEDFTRPGRMWWSVPKGVTTFGTWRELTTVYHEGVPGHHLQCAQQALRSDTLNRWRRSVCWVSGHGEGWALYAERLMDDLGFMDDPGNRMGFLDGQSMRAARVVLDIGVHCGLEAPAEVGGGAWTYDKAWAFLRAHTNMDEATQRFELHRYLGWPGQAPSYKVGERLWLDLRDEVARREGAAFSPKAFHKRALDLGSLPLDVLREAVLG